MKKIKILRTTNNLWSHHDKILGAYFPKAYHFLEDRKQTGLFHMIFLWIQQTVLDDYFWVFKNTLKMTF